MRQPYSVLVFPFRRDADGPRFAVFRRSDDSNWQSVAGGVEGDETLAEAARRETAEEAAITARYPLYKLDMVSGVAKTWFAARKEWPEDLYIVEKHFFGMDVTDQADAIALSHEHDDFRWVAYDDAESTLRYDDDKTALWELDERIRRDDLPAAID